MHSEKAIYRVLHEGSNITAFFAKRLEFQEKLTFTHAFWINSAKSKCQIKIKQLESLHYTF